MPLPKPKLPAGWRRAKLIALINELYLSFRGCGTCGVVVNALALSTNPQAGPLRYSLAFHLRRSKKPNSEPKLRPPAVSKSLTRSRLIGGLVPGIERQPRQKLEPSPEQLLAVLHRWRDEAVRPVAQSRGLRLPSKPAATASGWRAGLRH